MVVYSEEKVLVSTPTERRYQSLFSKNIEGRWTLEGDSKLTLEGFGVANKLQLGDTKKVLLKVQARVHDPRVNSLQIIMDKSLSVFGPHGETAAEFCVGH